MKEKLDDSSDFEDENENKKLIPKEEDINKLKENLGNGPAPEAGLDGGGLNKNLSIDNKSNKSLNGDLGIIKKPLSILILDGTGSDWGFNTSNFILNNGSKSNERFKPDEIFQERDVIKGNGAKVARLCFNKTNNKYNSFNFEDFCSNKTKKYDVIVVYGLNKGSDKYILDFIAKKIGNGNDNNLIFGGYNSLSSGQNLGWFKYTFGYNFPRGALELIESFDKKSGKIAKIETIYKKDLELYDWYQKEKIIKLKGTAGDPNDIKNIFKNHYGKIIGGLVLFEEIVFGKVRKNLPKVLKGKEIKNNKDNKSCRR